MNLIALDQILDAQKRTAPLLNETPLLRSDDLSERLGVDVYLKMETEHPTGSFKVRGAINKLSILKTEGAESVVTASTGNHGAAVAYAGGLLGVDVIVYVPNTINSWKYEKLNSFGVQLNRIGNDGIVAEKEARSFAERSGTPYVSPYNDIDVIAGQGTIGLEMQSQNSRLDSVYISLGGGGLAGGVASAYKTRKLPTQIVACSPMNSPVMLESIRKGQIVDYDSRETISDGTAGGLETGAITFPICRQAIDHHVAVEEKMIRDVTAILNFDIGIRAEGAAGLALAGAIDHLEKSEDTEKQINAIAIVLCGANIDEDTLVNLANEFS